MAYTFGPKKVLSAVSALDATSAEVYLVSPERIRTSVVFGAGTSAGTVVLEYSPAPGFAGAWAIVATMAWSVANAIGSAIPSSAPGFYRMRVSVAVVGGTIDGYIAAN